jgi:C_GCAxxG_C_C family probable redox protein
MTLDIIAKFNQKIKQLENTLPKMRKGVNCAELTMTSVLDVLGIDSYVMHNATMPLAGGFGGYKSKKGWMGACGAVSGGCAALGVIAGGSQKMDEQKMNLMYLKAAKFAHDFEGEFGSVICSELCGYDFSTPNGFLDYQKNNIWSQKCFKFVLWAINHVQDMSRKDLKQKWK